MSEKLLMAVRGRNRSTREGSGGKEWIHALEPRLFFSSAQLLAVTNGETPSSNPTGFVQYNGLEYFNATLGISIPTQVAWQTDGTSAGTVPATSQPVTPIITYGSDPHGAVQVNGLTYYIAFNGSQEAPWVSDGTIAGTFPLASVTVVGGLTAVGSNIYFVVPTGSGPALWESNGTLAGTVAIGAPSITSPYSTIKDMVSFGGNLYFISNPDDIDFGLWKTDGTVAGTVEIAAGADEAVVSGGLLYYADRRGKVYRSDGTPGGTFSVGQANGLESGSQLIALNGGVFFIGYQESTGSEPWFSDGTDAGTKLLGDLSTGSFSAFDTDYTKQSTQQFLVISGELFFNADDRTHGIELWKSNGTVAGTTLVKDIKPGTLYSSPTDFFAFNGKLLFTADDGVHGRELWTSDGTTVGTFMLRDLNDTTESSAVDALTNLGGRLIFAGSDGLGHQQLYATDGTTAGTELISNATPIDQITGSFQYPYRNRIVVGSQMYFAGSVGGASPGTLYVTDGTPLGTQSLSVSGVVDFTQINGVCYFYVPQCQL